MSKPIKVGFDKRVFNEVYIPFYKNSDRYLLFYGGAGSGKSEFAAAKILIRMMKEKHHRFLICRKVAKTIRNSQFQLLMEVVKRWGLTSLFKFHTGDLRVTCLLTQSEIISAGLDDVEKLKSITDITGIWVEEMTELLPEDWRQLNLRMRGIRKYYKQIIGTFNPIDEHHWIKKTFFPKDDIDSNVYRSERKTEFGSIFCTALRTTYRDNRYLDDVDRTILEALEQEDENYYRIYALGKWGAQTKGLIYKKNWVLTESFPDNVDARIYGLDFGFVNPTALIEIGFKDGKIYLRELLYKKGLTNNELLAECLKLIPNKTDFIYADPAEPARIKEFYESGFNIHLADKSVKVGIDFCISQTLNVSSDADNLIIEFRGYKWKVDKNGNELEEPLKYKDHGMDAMRYALYTHYLNHPNYFVTNKPAIEIVLSRKSQRHDITQGF